MRERRPAMSDPHIRAELAKAEIEPLPPIEKKLIEQSLGISAGLFVNLVFSIASRRLRTWHRQAREVKNVTHEGTEGEATITMA